ncbi:hypothetical protein [Kineococcus sp. SYSU DK018]|uniref:hypothetical protein n=1 Tax=Kineococcus sp. SYSU DK018 TaxID=3383139 RepID=UPI003D7D44B0
MAGHDFRVVKGGNPDLTQLYVFCSCGWQSRRLGTQRLALLAAREHGCQLSEGQRWIVDTPPPPLVCVLCGQPITGRRLRWGSGKVHPPCAAEERRRAPIREGLTFRGQRRTGRP